MYGRPRSLHANLPPYGSLEVMAKSWQVTGCLFESESVVWMITHTEGMCLYTCRLVRRLYTSQTYGESRRTMPFQSRTEEPSSHVLENNAPVRDSSHVTPVTYWRTMLQYVTPVTYWRTMLQCVLQSSTREQCRLSPAHCLAEAVELGLNALEAGGGVLHCWGLDGCQREGIAW